MAMFVFERPGMVAPQVHWTIDLNIGDKFSHQQKCAKEPGEKTFTGWQYGYGLIKVTRSHMGWSN